MKLRMLEPYDVNGILTWMEDGEVVKYFRLSSESKNREAISRFIENSFTDLNKHFAIVNDENDYLGTVSLKNIDKSKNEAEFAIVLIGSNIGKGFGKFAITEILKYASDELGLERIYLNVFDENTKAKGLYENIGFKWYKNSKIEIDGHEKVLNWYEYIYKY